MLNFWGETLAPLKSLAVLPLTGTGPGFTQRFIEMELSGTNEFTCAAKLVQIILPLPPTHTFL